MWKTIAFACLMLFLSACQKEIGHVKGIYEVDYMLIDGKVIERNDPEFIYPQFIVIKSRHVVFAYKDKEVELPLNRYIVIQQGENREAKTVESFMKTHYMFLVKKVV